MGKQNVLLGHLERRSQLRVDVNLRKHVTMKTKKSADLDTTYHNSFAIRLDPARVILGKLL